MSEELTEDLKKLSLRERLAKLKRLMADKAEGIADDVDIKTAMRLRSEPKMLNRWRIYCGVDDNRKIDYSNPCVIIEFAACDPSIYALADDAERFCEVTGADVETYRKYYLPGVEGA